MSPQRADAANIAPYLTHTISHHGQVTLIPPDNAGRIRQAKPKKSKGSRQDRNTRKEEDVRFNTGPKLIRLPQPRSNDRRARNTSRQANNQPAREGEYSDDIPDYPPPTFWEAISTPALSVCPSTSTLPLIQNSQPGSRAPSNSLPPLELPSHPLPSEVRRSPDASSDSDSDGSLEVVEREPEEISTQRSQFSESPLTELHRGRSPNREAIDLDSEQGDGPPTPTTFTPPKRRYLSLSPLRTLFPHRNLGMQERALSAHPSSPYSLSRNSSSFFRSTTSLSSNSFFRFPLSNPSCTSLTKTDRKGSFKGKERIFEALDSWEVIEKDPPTSLMSAIESMTNPPTPDSGTPSPTQNPVLANEPAPLPPLTDKKTPFPAVKKPARPRPTPLPQGQSANRSVAPVAALPNTQSNAGPPIVTVRTRNIPPPAPREVTPPTSLLSAESWDSRQMSSLNIQSAPSDLHLAINTPLPPTPTDKKSEAWHPSVSHATRSLESSGSYPGTPQRQYDLTQPRNVALSTSACTTQKPNPGPLQLPFPTCSSLSFSGDSDSTSQTPLHTPSRRHYAGRPLPQPPLPSPEPLRGLIDSTYAPNEDAKIDSVTMPCPEGLLIDFDEATPLSTYSTVASTPERTSTASIETVIARPRAGTGPPFSTQSSQLVLSRNPSFTEMIPISDDRTHTSSRYSPQSVPGDTSRDPLIAPVTSTAAPSSGSTRELGEVPRVRRMDTTSSARSVDTRGAYSDVTDLDLLVSRMTDADLQNGSNYDTLLLVSDFLGPGNTSRSTSTSKADPSTSEAGLAPLLGRVFLDRRRITKEGRVKVKLSLLDVPVDKCGICLTQFKEKDVGAMSATCRHTFHEGCLRKWLDHGRAKTCPQCRAPLGDFSSDSFPVAWQS